MQTGVEQRSDDSDGGHVRKLTPATFGNQRQMNDQEDSDGGRAVPHLSVRGTGDRGEPCELKEREVEQVMLQLARRLNLVA